MGGNALNLSSQMSQGSMTSAQVPGSLNKSDSMTSLGPTNEKLQRSQVNIDRRMREDFDRLQGQLKKRKEKEDAAMEA